MIVAETVQLTVQLLRALRCEHARAHEWQRHTDSEDRCTRCGVIATGLGKENLEAMARRRFGAPSGGENEG